MRVLHILHEIRPSGAEVMLFLAAPNWISEGCQLAAIAAGVQQGSYAENLQASGFEIEHSPWTGRIDRTFLNLIAAIRRQSPDVVHVHTEGNSAILVTAISLLGVPVVRTIHNSFPYAGFLRIRKICERFLERMSAYCQISISKSVFENERNRLKNRTELCWNWFNDAHFRPPTTEERSGARRALGLSPEEIVLVSVGNGNDVKNYPAIIGALSELRVGSGESSVDSSGEALLATHSTRHASPATLANSLLYLMVGNEHPKQIERKSAERLGLSDSVRFCGPQADVRKYLWAADIFIMPSIYEGFGLSAVEAVATGIPCVLSDCPGLRDFRDFAFDVRWSGTDAASIAATIRAVMANGGWQTKNIVSAAAVRAEFGVERRANEYLRLWKGATKSGRRKVKS